MKLRFSRDALIDIDELKSWLKPLAPNGYSSVIKRVTATIRVLNQYPESGRATALAGVREVIEPKYGFVIPYTVRDETIWILRVYSSRRYPLNYNALPEPRD